MSRSWWPSSPYSTHTKFEDLLQDPDSEGSDLEQDEAIDVSYEEGYTQTNDLGRDIHTNQEYVYVEILQELGESGMEDAYEEPATHVKNAQELGEKQLKDAYEEPSPLVENAQELEEKALEDTFEEPSPHVANAQELGEKALEDAFEEPAAHDNNAQALGGKLLEDAYEEPAAHVKGQLTQDEPARHVEIAHELEESDLEESSEEPAVLVGEQESDDEAMEAGRNTMRGAISPLSRDRSPHFFGVLEPSPSKALGRGIRSSASRGRAQRGSSARSGAREVRRCGSVRHGAVEIGQAWVRGNRLLEKFRTPEEIPEKITQRLEEERLAQLAREQANAPPIGEWHDAQEFRAYNPNEFVWEAVGNEPGENRQPFLTECTGPTRLFNDAYDAFRAYWTDEIVTHIATETNEYAQCIQSERFRRDWFVTDFHEILILFAFWITLGINRMPTIKSCYSLHPILKTDIFRHLLSESRYWNLNRAFHMARGCHDANDPDNLLYPVQHLIDHFDRKCRELFVPGQNICIDKSLALWKEALGFRRYIKTKVAKYSIMNQQLCDSATGYLWSFCVYLCSRGGSSMLPKHVSTVLQLIKPLFFKGYTVFMDNWFNSPILARYLKQQGTDCVGTLRPNRRHVPAIIQVAPLQEGEFLARTSGDVKVVALQDRQRLHLISTYHDLTQVHKPERPGRPAQYKLKLVDDYNRSMGGVDRLDQMLEPYLVERKQCRKWTKKLFKRILNISIQNARILVEQSTGNKIDALAFRMSLVQSIMDKHLVATPRVAPHHRQSLARLTERHFIERIPVTAENSKASHRTNRARSRCSWCPRQQRSRRTVYRCKQCEVPLCLETCFEEYHTIS